MANIVKDFSYMEFPMSIARQDGFPLDKYQLFFSLEDATNFASTSPLAYPTFIIGVINEQDQTADNYVIQYDGTLKPLGGSGSKTKIVASESEMLALTDVEIGQTVFRTDINRTYILVNSDSTQVSSWRTEAVDPAPTWDSIV